MNSQTSLGLIISIIVLGFSFIVGGCASVQYYTPPPYDGYKPELPLAQTAALHFAPYDEGKPLLNTRHKYNYVYDSYIEIPFGFITVRTVTSAAKQLFSECVELRTPEISDAVRTSQIGDLLAEGVEVQESSLHASLEACRQRKIDLLLVVSVLEYTHSNEEVKMTMSWATYDVTSTQRLFLEKANARKEQSNIPRLFLAAEDIIPNAELSRDVIATCVETLAVLSNIIFSA